MKRKTSILINIASLCLCIGALVVGVISAKTTTASLSGTVSFVAHNAKVYFQGKIEGARINNTAGTYYIQQAGAPTNEETSFHVGGENSITSAVSFGDISFDYNSDYTPKEIKFIFSMRNDSEYEIVASISLANINLTPGIICSANEYMVKIAKNDTGNIELTLKVDSVVSINGENSKINFEFKKFNSQDFQVLNSTGGFTGTVDNEIVTISNVPAKTSSTTLTIPAYFYDATSDKLLRVKNVDNNHSKMSNVEGYVTLIFSEGITTLGQYLLNNTTTTTIKLPLSITTIQSGAFLNCTALTTVNIPYGVTSLSNCFSGCSNLTNIDIPESVQSISTNCFSNTRITSLILPSKIASLSMNACNTMSELTTLHIKSKEIKFWMAPFGSCPKLTTVYIDGDVINNSMSSSGNDDNVSDFGGCSSVTTFYIKSGYSPCAYISTNFTKQTNSGVNGYEKWTKNS